MKYFNHVREWQKIIRDYENSGLSIREYCKLKGISKSTFYRNISLIKEINNELDIETYPNKITIYVNGNKIEFDPTIDDKTLARIIKIYSKG